MVPSAVTIAPALHTGIAVIARSSMTKALGTGLLAPQIETRIIDGPSSRARPQQLSPTIYSQPV
jgi:hypothetical protein